MSAKGGEGDGVSNWTSSGVIGERSIEDEEVSLVDGVLEGALGALGFGNGGFWDVIVLKMVMNDEERWLIFHRCTISFCVGDDHLEGIYGKEMV
ncbi:hypothetical protein Tco_1449440 [Tanacetum coccineum]